MEETLKLTPETCENILKIMSSNDQSNLTIAVETIRNINVVENLPYLLIMYKHSTAANRKTVFLDTILEKLQTTCKTLHFKDNAQSLTYNNLYNELKTHTNVHPQAMDYFIDKFSESLSDVMISWGFSFMEDFKLKLTPRKNGL